MRIPDDAVLPPAQAGARPLEGRTVLITRAREQAGVLRALLEGAGARVEECPAIRFEPPVSWEPLDAALRTAQTYDWIVFTSANTVRFVFERLYVLGFGARALIGPRVIAIGPSTAQALERAGLPVDTVPEEFRAEAVAAAIAAAMPTLEGARVLLPRAETARDILPDTLRARGATVDVRVAYRTAPDPDGLGRARALLAAGEVDAITFTASSTVRALLDVLGDPAAAMLARCVVAAIGPITADTLREAGIEPAVVASEYTTVGLVGALAAHWRPASAS